jgi:hypothetical protein
MDAKSHIGVYYCMWCGSVYDYLPKDGECLKCHQRQLQYIKKLDNNNMHPRQIIKLQSSEVIESMRNGNYWFQSPRYFQEYSGDGKVARMDMHDAKYFYVDKGRYIDDKNADKYRLLCFYSLNVDDSGNFLKPFDERLSQFGECFSIVDLETLLIELQKYIKSGNNNMSYVGNDVKYIREDRYSGFYSPLCKFSKFDYQNEFRIVLLSDTFLSLGDFNPYKTIAPTNNLGSVIGEPQPIDILLRAKNINDF